MEDSQSDTERTVKDAQFAREPECRDVDWYLYRRRYRYPPVRDGLRCEGSKYYQVGRFGEFHQCESKGKHEWQGHRWCGVHHPPTVEAKKQARSDEWARERAAQSARYRIAESERQQRYAALEAIKKIAAGHNDPRGLAMEVLGLNAATDQEQT